MWPRPADRSVNGPLSKETGSECLSPFRLHYQNTEYKWLVNNRCLFAIVLESGSPRSVCEGGWIPLRILFWACRLLISCVLTWPRAERWSRLCQDSHEDANPIHEGSTSMTSLDPNYLSKAPPLMPSHWGGTSSTYELWGNTFSALLRSLLFRWTKGSFPWIFAGTIGKKCFFSPGELDHVQCNITYIFFCWPPQWESLAEDRTQENRKRKSTKGRERTLMIISAS